MIVEANVVFMCLDITT